MHVSKPFLAATAVLLLAGTAVGQNFDRDSRFKFEFDRKDRKGNVEGKRASCEVYARIADVQAYINRKYRCGYRGPRWVEDLGPHFFWCRFVPRRVASEEQRARAEDLRRCFDRLGDFDDDDSERRGRR